MLPLLREHTLFAPHSIIASAVPSDSDSHANLIHRAMITHSFSHTFTCHICVLRRSCMRFSVVFVWRSLPSAVSRDFPSAPKKRKTQLPHTRENIAPTHAFWKIRSNCISRQQFSLSRPPSIALFLICVHNKNFTHQQQALSMVGKQIFQLITFFCLLLLLTASFSLGFSCLFHRHGKNRFAEKAARMGWSEHDDGIQGRKNTEKNVIDR